MYKVQINDDAVQAALDRLGGAFDDMTRPFERIGEALRVSSQKRIDQGISPDGTPFAPRSQTTLDAYADRKPPVVPKGGPLKLWGRMQAEINYTAEAKSLEVGSDAIQSAVMQFGAIQGQFRKAEAGKGGSVPWGNIPARPFIGISAEDSDMILETLEGWIGGLAAGP